MEVAALSALKKELKHCSREDLEIVCLQLAKYKKENKELLHYLLFEQNREENYIQAVQSEIDTLFAPLHKVNTYITTKSSRKILRLLTKYAKFSGQKTTEVSLLIHFCKAMRLKKLHYPATSALGGIYTRQVLKIEKLISKLHEDYQLDYLTDLEELQE